MAKRFFFFKFSNFQICFQIIINKLIEGTIIKGWKIEKKLGEGAFSEVYEVSSVSDPSSRYAMKIAPLMKVSKKTTTELTKEAIRLHWEHTVNYLFY